jgi:hypothetical protein
MVPNRRLRPTALNAQLHEGFGVSTSRHPPSIRLPAKPCPGRLTVATAFGTAEFAAPHESVVMAQISKSVIIGSASSYT